MTFPPLPVSHLTSQYHGCVRVKRCAGSVNGEPQRIGRHVVVPGIDCSCLGQVWHSLWCVRRCDIIAWPILDSGLVGGYLAHSVRRVRFGEGYGSQVDEIHSEFSSEAGNVLTMVKRQETSG